MGVQTLRLVDFLYWTATASTGVSTIAAILALAIDGTLVTVKVLLFVCGMLLLGIGSLSVRPAPAAPHKDEMVSTESDTQIRLEAWIQQLPPLKSNPLRYTDRISRGWKILATGIVVLGISAFMEFGLGITVSSV